MEKYGLNLEYEKEKHYLFPNPKLVAKLKPEELRELQFSTSKAKYLINVAAAFADQSISKKKILALADFDAKQKCLTTLKGIGVWTANYALMKSLKEQTCVPYGDAGLMNALINHGIIRDKSDTGPMHALFDSFKGWESYLVIYLWRSLAPMKDF